jgi:hypothetical protein
MSAERGRTVVVFHSGTGQHFQPPLVRCGLKTRGLMAQ